MLSAGKDSFYKFIIKFIKSNYHHSPAPNDFANLYQSTINLIVIFNFVQLIAVSNHFIKL